MSGKGFKDPRYLKVIGFLAVKGLLYAPKVRAVRRAALNIRDALWVAENLEPRVLEVLPAAVLHFPRAFLDLEKMPNDLAEVVTALKSGFSEAVGFRGVPWEKIRTWANKPLNDGRVKPCDEKKVLRTFRLSRKSIALLEQAAKERGLSNTEVLESCIQSLG